MLFSRKLPNGSHDFVQIFRIFFLNYFIKNSQTTIALTFLTHIISAIGGVNRKIYLMQFQQLFFNLHIFFTLLYSALNYIAVGTNDQNRVKNQSDTVIPFDRNRVILTPDNQRQDSTYINASFIEGYHNDESFIITQVFM